MRLFFIKSNSHRSFKKIRKEDMYTRRLSSEAALNVREEDYEENMKLNE
jgi:hypothetical protein